jgi:D-alanine-D-alanine ligase
MSVVILHHTSNVASDPEKQKYCAESNAGVLVEVAAITEAFDKLGVPWTVKTISRLSELRAVLAASPEPIVFNLVEELCGHPQDASVVPSIIRAMGKGFTGSDSFALMLALDKWRTKAMLKSLGLPTPPAGYVPVGRKLSEKLPQGKYIVKPVCTDASEGIDDQSVVEAPGREMGRIVRRIHDDFRQAAVVEKFIDGRELNVSVIQFDDGPRALPIAEIDFSDFTADMPRIINYAAKWQEDSFVYNHTPRIIPAKLSAKTAKEVSRLAEAAWHAIGCRGYARIDFRLDKKDNPWIIEVNANPDLSPECGLAAAVGAAGLKYEEFIRMMYEQAGGIVPARPGKATMKKTQKKQTLAFTIERACEADHKDILAFMEDTKFFRPDEMVIAGQVLDDAHKQGSEGDYHSFTAKVDGKPVGWVCYGETPCTLGTYDVYWLAVDPKCQGLGIGRKLMDFAEAGIKAAGGRIAIVETSGSQRYVPTRAFYEQIGYKKAASVEDFYAPGDAKIIYTKLV